MKLKIESNIVEIDENWETSLREIDLLLLRIMLHFSEKD